MAVRITDLIQNLDEEDKEKVVYFAKLLLKQEKYQKLRREISERRSEIKNGKTLEHEAFWKTLNV